MLRIRLEHAKPGMVLAMPVYHPENRRTALLRAGVELDAHCIPRLAEMKVEDLWIHYPGLEHLVRYVDPLLQKQYRRLIDQLGAATDQAFVQSNIELDFYSCRRAVLGVLKRLGENQHAQQWLGKIAGADRPFVRHSGNVCVMSLLMGLKLDFYLVRERPRLAPHHARDLTSLGLGALFHDIGMLRLDEKVLGRWNATRDETDPAWRRHVAIGFEMLRGQLEPSAAAIALNHHQRWDGEGFPRRDSFQGPSRPLKEREVHVLTRIVCAAESFNRVMHPAHAPGADEAGAPSIPTVRALKVMLEEGMRKRLDPVVFRALFTVTPPYPPGSLVRLSDGALAAVVEWSPMDPCRPVVELTPSLERRSARRRAPKALRIDLRKHLELSVAEIDGEDVLEDNFAPREEGEFDLMSLYRSMNNRAFDDLEVVPAEDEDGGEVRAA